ncbi:hypothetical protein [Krasilnikovia sp. M28-CT-15]|uniref:hypothetical protein n=1 Tax=Krasilnikovia sp. M28-CT-15 TaxID=3373540 RepID=UPI00399D50A6
MVGDVISGAASSAWESVCKSFAEAAVTMLKGFAEAFAAFPNVDLTSSGVRSVYGLSLGIAGFVAVLLLLLQIARTVITHDGNALAQGFIGVGKAALAFLATLTVASTALVAADAMTAFIIRQSFGSTQGLTTKLTTLFEFDTLQAPSLILLLAVIGIVLVLVLWFELLLRNAAVVALIATSPIAAVGMVSDATKQWWSQLVSATVRLIVLKPVIALVFALGFGVAGNEDKDLATLLAGMLILLLAALAWPAIARFFTFAAAHSGGPSGLAAVLGFAGGQTSSAGGGQPAGVDPSQFGKHAEARTMAEYGSRAEAASSAAGGASGAGAGAGAGGAGGAGAAGAGGAAAGAAAGAAGAGIPLVVAKGVEMAQRAANSLVGRMEQTAGHAGLPGASPYAQPAGYPRPVPPMNSSTTGGSNSDSPPSGDSGSGNSAPPPGEVGGSRGSAVESGTDAAGRGEAGSALPAPSPGPAEHHHTAGANSMAAEPGPSGGEQSTPVIPQQRSASPVEQARPEPSPSSGQVGPVEHVRPVQSSPVEHQKGEQS